MIKCVYFLGLNKKGFIKDVKMDDYRHDEASLPKIGELFTGRYDSDEPTRFVSFIRAYRNDELVFMSKENKIEKVDEEKVNIKIKKSFQNLINELSSMKSEFAEDYSLLHKDIYSFSDNETSFNIETIKLIEKIYDIKADPVKEININNIQSEMNTITCLSSILDDNNRQKHQFNIRAIGMITSGLIYANHFEIIDVLNSAYKFSFSSSEENKELKKEESNYYVSYNDLLKQWHSLEISSKNIEFKKIKNHF